MSVTVTGQLAGRQVSATWAEGKITGDEQFVAAIQALAKEQGPVGVAGYTVTAGTADPQRFAMTAASALDELTEITGEVPDDPDEPADAIY